MSWIEADPADLSSAPTGRRTARMYNSKWRSDLSSSSFCGEDHSECTGTIYDSNAAAPRGLSALLAGLAPALLLFLIV